MTTAMTTDTPRTMPTKDWLFWNAVAHMGAAIIGIGIAIYYFIIL